MAPPAPSVANDNGQPVSLGEVRAAQQRLLRMTRLRRSVAAQERFLCYALDATCRMGTPRHLAERLSRIRDMRQALDRSSSRLLAECDQVWRRLGGGKGQGASDGT